MFHVLRAVSRALLEACLLQITRIICLDLSLIELFQQFTVRIG